MVVPEGSKVGFPDQHVRLVLVCSKPSFHMEVSHRGLVRRKIARERSPETLVRVQLLLVLRESNIRGITSIGREWRPKSTCCGCYEAEVTGAKAGVRH